MKILVTGAAGFIGYHLTKRLLKEGHIVIGIDNINAYYDPLLKYRRLEDCGINGKLPFIFGKQYVSANWENYRFLRIELEDKEGIIKLFKDYQFEIVVHLAAQSGIRFSLEKPWTYINSNIIGTMSILESCRHFPVTKLIYASSSSVYGISEQVPFSTDQKVDQPISLYAATKKSNELMAYTYSWLYHIPTIGLRFFTVYGPWGRPDMAYFKFTKKILEGIPIDVYNYGELWRDFTYIDDIVEGIIRIIEKRINKTLELVPYSLYNIGNSTPVRLIDFISILEQLLNKKAIMNPLDMQPGDVPMTYADVKPLAKDFGFKPKTKLEVGLREFLDWYLNFYLNYTSQT
jgi:UDP-glucuronate 4-epimerase